MYMNVSDVKDKQAVLEELRVALKRAKLSQAWAAGKLGITKAHLSRVLNKQSNASLELIIELKELADKVNSLNFDEAV